MNRATKVFYYILISIVSLYGVYILSNITGGPYVEKEVFYIPKHYRGNIYVIYNMDDGIKGEYHKKTRINRIPASGVLITQLKPNTGVIRDNSDFSFYFVSGQGKIIDTIPYIPYLYDYQNIDVVGVNLLQYSGMTIEGEDVHYLKVTVDTLSKQNSKYSERLDNDYEIIMKAIKNR